jgi:hypothetical protein
MEESMRIPPAGRNQWLELTALVVALPLVIGLAVLGFAWPAARIAPRHLPVGVVGATPAAQATVAHLNAAQPGGFDVHVYLTDSDARAAITDREVYGALEVGNHAVTVLQASAASPAVAQLLTAVGQKVAAADSKDSASGAPAVFRAVDLVPEPAGDPRGIVLSATLLPLTICSIIIASVIALAVQVRPAWRQAAGLVALAAASGASAYVIAQGFLGALPGDHLATWASLSLTILAISASTAGLISLAGPAGLGIGAVLFVFLGNPFSGVTSAPDLLPAGVRDIGQWLPPGAGANLLRSTAYFHDNGSRAHLAVLLVWATAGLLAVVAGHRDSTTAAPTPVPVPAAAAQARTVSHARA